MNWLKMKTPKEILFDELKNKISEQSNEISKLNLKITHSEEALRSTANIVIKLDTENENLREKCQEFREICSKQK